VDFCERTLWALSVPVVTVGRPKVAPRESENEVPAVAAAEGVGKTEVSGIKVVSEGMVLARV
jgi:hypothetical protein